MLAEVPGITDLAVLRSLGQPTIRIDVDRERAARYGLAPGDVNSVVQAAIGGQSPGDLYEEGSDRHYPIIVRLAAPYRQSLEAIRRIPIAAQNAAASATVDFPEPLSPTSATHAPRGTSSDTSSSPTTAPKRLETCSATRAM